MLACRSASGLAGQVGTTTALASPTRALSSWGSVARRSTSCTAAPAFWMPRARAWLSRSQKPYWLT